MLQLLNCNIAKIVEKKGCLEQIHRVSFELIRGTGCLKMNKYESVLKYGPNDE